MMTRLLSKALMLALLIQAGIIVSAPAQGGRPIQFSEPRSDKVNTNLARLNQGLSRLDRLESELSRPFDFITPGNSMQGGFITAPLPTPPPAVNNPRVKELIDRKRDLPFMTQEEVFRVESPEDKFKAPELTQDGRDRNTLRPMERALLDRDNNFEPGRSLSLPGREQNPQVNRFNDQHENPALRGLTDGERGLRNLVNGNSPFEDRSLSSPRSASDFFGLGDNPASKSVKRTDSELQRIEQFKQLYDFGSRPEGVTAREAAQFSNPYLESSFYDPPRVTAPAVSAASGSSAFGASAFGAASFTYTPTSTPTPPPAPVHTPASSPFISVPKRPF